MSYYHVLVFTPEEPSFESLTRAMAPFQEYDGKPSPHTVDEDVTDEYLSYFAKDHPGVEPTPDVFRSYIAGDSVVVLEDGQGPATKYKLGVYAYAIVDGDTTRVFRRTNPQGYWDFWGFPESPFLRYLGDGEGNACRVRDLDFAAMRQERLDRYQAEWGGVHRHLPSDFDREAHRPWAFYAEGLTTSNRAQVVQSYRNQDTYNAIADAIDKAFAGQDVFMRETSVDDFALSLPEYLDAQMSTRGYVFHAVIPESGKWVSNGTMGFFAIVIDADPEWGTKTLPTTLANLPPDGWVTAVRCHI